MHRIDNSKFLLFIEPKKEDKSSTPINDQLTEIIQFALSQSKQGASNYYSLDNPEHFTESIAYKGFHTTDCGEYSSNVDYLLENGMITNSLCTFYLRWYRKFIPQSELDKVKRLLDFYKIKEMYHFNKK